MIAGQGLNANPVPPSTRVKAADAADLLERFTGHEARHVRDVKMDPNPVALHIGKVDGILYETKRDGVKERYIHRFKGKSRPALAVAHDGKTAYILGGGWEFTERGFIDKRR